MGVLFLILTIVFFVLWTKEKKTSKLKAEETATANQQIGELTSKVNQVSSELDTANQRIETLSKYQAIVDIEAHCKTLQDEADREISSQKILAQQEAEAIRAEAKAAREAARRAKEKADTEANLRLSRADSEAKRILETAEEKAKAIAGSAYEAMEKAEEYKSLVASLKNVVKGYGDEWIKPTFTLLDDLAADFGYTEAGQRLKAAQENSLRMVKEGTAGTSKYISKDKREGAVSFIIYAFNGQVDSILAKSKKDNYGVLEQKIKDVYNLVNSNGATFREAKITPQYLESRLEELKWAVVCHELKAQQQEEQRRIREQMREEEKARREYERAQKEAAKEEALIRKAMEKAQAAMEKASAEQRSKYEAQLAELQQKLTEAEEKNQRAISMAHQTKRGNVYVISNIGSFGENVYKVGMTRRLEPLDRVRELGDASVPFPFDVHAIIESDDAPALETNLHKAMALMQVNKANPRKEFFRISLADIHKLVDNMGYTANWTMEAAAAEYRETLAIEESMKNDPEAKRRWEEYNESLERKSVEADTEPALA